MSAVFAGGQFRAPARFSNAKMGRPVAIGEIVPGKDRKNYKHKIFWAASAVKTADQYNSVVTLYKNPCVRRWLEFKGGRVPKTLNYYGHTPVPCRNPLPITPKPSRYWTVLMDGQEYACYTNCVEAWLIVLSGERFSPGHKWAMLYTDRSGR